MFGYVSKFCKSCRKPLPGPVILLGTLVEYKPKNCPFCDGRLAAQRNIKELE